MKGDEAAAARSGEARQEQRPRRGKVARSAPVGRQNRTTAAEPTTIPRKSPRPAIIGNPAAIRLSALLFLSETLLISSCATATTILPPGSAPWGQWGTRLGK